MQHVDHVNAPDIVSWHCVCICTVAVLVQVSCKLRYCTVTVTAHPWVRCWGHAKAMNAQLWCQGCFKKVWLLRGVPLHPWPSRRWPGRPLQTAMFVGLASCWLALLRALLTAQHGKQVTNRGGIQPAGRARQFTLLPACMLLALRGLDVPPGWVGTATLGSGADCEAAYCL